MGIDHIQTGRESDKFMLRLPEGMRDQLAQAAKASGRSMNAEVVARLQGSFEDQYSTKLGREGILVMLGSVLQYMSRAVVSMSVANQATFAKYASSGSVVLARALQDPEGQHLEEAIRGVFPAGQPSSIKVMADVLRDAALATDMNSAVSAAQREEMGRSTSPVPGDLESPLFKITAEMRPSGNLNLKGDPEAIKSVLQAGGITNFVPMRGGIQVAVSQSEAAAKLIEGSALGGHEFEVRGDPPEPTAKRLTRTPRK